MIPSMGRIRAIAVTGGIASGKSTVLGIMESHGLRVASADVLARADFESQEVQEGLASLSGLPTPIDRAALGAAMASSHGLRRAVNGLLHPRIMHLLRTCEADAIEVPLLIEACLQGEFDEVWAVVCDPQTQLDRLTARLGDEALARRWIEAQLPLSAKVPFADAVVRTNFPIQNVHAYVSAMLK